MVVCVLGGSLVVEVVVFGDYVGCFDFVGEEVVGKRVVDNDVEVVVMVSCEEFGFDIVGDDIVYFL